MRSLSGKIDEHAVPAAGRDRSSAQAQTAVPEGRWLWLGYGVIGALLLYHLFYIASGRIELSPDEAYQWLWSKHLALSYYSKPPLIAFTQFLGTFLWGDTELGVRFFSPVISAMIGVIILRFFAREISARLGFVLVLATNAAPLLIVGSNLMTVDPLNVLFWIAAMLAGWRAVQPEGTTRDWLWVGLWMGLGFLSKYTELFQLLCWAVYFWLWPPARRHLRRPGPYLAVLANVVLTLPVLIWNAQHGWITVAHVGDRAEFGHVFRFTPGHLFEFLGVEAGLLNPVFFAGMAWAACAFWRQKPGDPRMVYFFSMGAPLFLAYLLQSLHARVLPNWIAPAIVPLFFVMVLYWDEHRHKRWVRLPFRAGVLLGLAATVLLSDTDLFKIILGRYLPVGADPLTRVRAWHEVARLTGDARSRLLNEGRPVFIICPDYGYAGEISFYLPEAKAAVRGVPLVYFKETERPESQFFFWPEYRYSLRVGDNAIFVDSYGWPTLNSEPPAPRPPPENLLREFRSVKSLGVFHADYRGRPCWWFQLFECREQRAKAEGGRSPVQLLIGRAR